MPSTTKRVNQIITLDTYEVPLRTAKLKLAMGSGGERVAARLAMAHYRGRGVRLSADEVDLLFADEAVARGIANAITDDEAGGE